MDNPTKDFLNALFADHLKEHQGFIELRIISPEKKTEQFFYKDIDALLEELPKHKQKGSHIYFGVNPRDQKGGKKENISFATTLFCDLDYGITGHKKASKWQTEAEALKALEGFEFPASIIVHSGYGLYGFWLLKEPVKIEDPYYIESIVKGIVEYLGGDPGTQDITRILRLPGTDNIKDPQNPKEVRILKFEPNLQYLLDDFQHYKADIENLPLKEIDFDGSDSKVDIADLPIKGGIKELIYLGNRKKHSFPSRSERDQAVVNTLVHASLKDGQIKEVFKNPAYGISDKYLEKKSQGDAYLALTIQKARASYEQWKKEHPKPDLDTLLGILRKGEFGYELYRPGKNKKPSTWEPVCNFLINYNKVIKSEEKTDIIGTLVVERDKKIPFVWASRVATNPQILKEELNKICPIGLKFMPEQIAKIGVAIGAKNEAAKEYIGTDTIGQRNDNIFLTHNFVIKNGLIEKNDSFYITNKNVRIYDFIAAPLEKCKEATDLIVNDVLTMHSYNLTLPLLGEIGRSPLIPKISDMLYVTFFRGPTGHGKSLIEKAMLNFYANISLKSDSQQAQAIKNFRDTVNHIEKHGHHLQNIPMMLDDFKIGVRGSNAMAIKLIQGYYNQGGRGRLTQRIEERDAYYLRCNLWMTGENLPDGEQSVLERILIYQVNARELKLSKLKKIEEKRYLLRMFTPHYIAWTQKHGPQEFEAEIKHPRLSAYIKQNLTGLKTILSFMLENKWIKQEKFDELMALGIKASELSFDYTEASAFSENIVESFIADIRELITSKSCNIASRDEYPDEDKRESYKPVIGEFNDDGTKVYIMPQKAIQEASRQLHHGEKKYSAKTLGVDLKEAEYLSEVEEKRPSVRKRLKHGCTSVWVFDKKKLLEEDIEEEKIISKEKEKEAEEEAKRLLKEDKKLSEIKEKDELFE